MEIAADTDLEMHVMYVYQIMLQNTLRCVTKYFRELSTVASVMLPFFMIIFLVRYVGSAMLYWLGKLFNRKLITLMNI